MNENYYNVIMGVASLILLFESVSIFMELCYQRHVKQCVAETLIILLAYLLLQVMAERTSGILDGTGIIERIACEISPITLLGVLIFIFLINCAQIIIINAWRMTHLSITSVKESIDELPDGVCLYRENGLVVLANPIFNKICIDITGKYFNNGIEFWNCITENRIKDNCSIVETSPDYVISTPNGVYEFKHTEKTIDGDDYFEIIAVDRSEEYELYETLEEKNSKLSEINHRIRLLGQEITQITIEKEVLQTKIKVHDELGEILIASRKYLESGQGMGEREELVNRWRNNLILVRDSEPEKVEDEYVLLRKTAADIDVDLVEIGELTQNEKYKSIVATAIHECMTNTVRYADGDTLTVATKESSEELVVELTNNGNPPQEEITERGGLLMLRRLVEASNGEMTIQSAPVFKLTLLFDKEKGR